MRRKEPRNQWSFSPRSRVDGTDADADGWARGGVRAAALPYYSLFDEGFRQFFFLMGSVTDVARGDADNASKERMGSGAVWD